MNDNGFIKLHRKITEWEWYKNPNTFRVFLHCLLSANFTDGRFEGREIKRGQFVTSLPTLAKQTLLSIQQVRTALDHLKSTGEITDSSCTKYRIITVVKYDSYQCDNRQNNSQSTDNQQTSNSQSTDKQQQYKNKKKERREEEKERYSLSESNTGTAKRFTPPSLKEVREYCESRDSHVDPDKFFDYYQSNGWKVGKNPMKDFKAAIRQWERSEITEREYQDKRKRLLEDLPF